MNLHALDVSAIGALGLASVTGAVTGANSYFGWFNFVNLNAPGIGVLLSIIFGIIGIIFMFKAAKKDKLANDNKKEIDEIKVGIELILDRLDKE